MSAPMPMRVITLGVHIVDVLVRPVQDIPEGQDGQLVDSIRIIAAGPAGGTALGVGCVAATRGADGALVVDAAADAFPAQTPIRSAVAS